MACKLKSTYFGLTLELVLYVQWIVQYVSKHLCLWKHFVIFESLKLMYIFYFIIMNRLNVFNDQY